MGFILAILAILLAFVAVIGVLMYVIAIAAIWILGITAVGLSLLFISLTGDPYIGVGLGVVTTLLTFGLYGHFSDKQA